MKRGATEHPKILMLADHLKIPKYQAVGLIETLLGWAAKYAIRGDVGKWSDAVIARGLEYEKDPGELVVALRESHWLDPAPAPFRLVIHDIKDHADNTWRQCLVDAGLTWWDGSAPRREKAGRPSKSQGDLNFEGIETPEKLQENSRETPQPEPKPKPEPKPVTPAKAVSASRDPLPPGKPVENTPPVKNNGKPATNMPPPKRHGFEAAGVILARSKLAQKYTPEQLEDARRLLLGYAEALRRGSDWGPVDDGLAAELLDACGGDFEASAECLAWDRAEIDRKRKKPGNSWGWFVDRLRKKGDVIRTWLARRSREPPAGGSMPDGDEPAIAGCKSRGIS
jgi:hypothetical protein